MALLRGLGAPRRALACLAAEGVGVNHVLDLDHANHIKGVLF